MDHRAQVGFKIISRETSFQAKFSNFHRKYTECYKSAKSKVDGPAKVNGPLKN